MEFKVIFRDTFLEDLEHIVKRIAVHNDVAAQRFGGDVVQTCESLSFFPERYPKVRQRPGIRRLIVHRYFKIFYRVHNEHRFVEILRLWDGRRGTDARVDDV